MIPHTVPKRPMKGAVLPTVARNGTSEDNFLLSALASRLTARAMRERS